MTLFTRRKKDEEDVPALNKVVQAEQAVQNAEAKRDKAVMNYALKNPVSPVIPKLNPVEEIHRQREQQRLTEAYNQRQASKEIPVLSIPKTNAIPETKRSQPHTDRINPVPKNTNPAPIPLQRLAQAEPESTFIHGGQEPRNTSGSFLREVERQQHQNVRDSFGNTAADYNGPNSASLWQEMRPRYVAGSQARYKGERVEMDNAANSRLFNYAQKAAGSEPFTQEELKDFQNLAYTVASDFEEKIKNQTVTPADIDLLNYVDGIYTSALTTKTIEDERPEGGYDVQEYTTPAFGTGEAYRNAFASQALNLPRMLTDAIIKDPDYQGWREANDARRAEIAAAHPYATMAGQATGTALNYALANSAAADAGLTEQIASRLAIENPALATSVANLMVGQGVDTALDTIPTEYMNYKNGMRGWELVNDTLKNQAINGLINMGAELPGLIGGLKNVDAAKQAQDALNAQNIRRFANVPELTDEGKVASGIVNGVQVGDLTGGEVRSLTDSLADVAKIPVLDEGKVTSGMVNGINVSDVTGGEVKDLVDPAFVDNRIGRVMTSLQDAPAVDRSMLDALGDLDKAIANSENVPEAAEKLGKVLSKNNIRYDSAALDDIIKAYGGEPKSYLPGITDAMEEQYPEQIAKIRSDMANYQTAMEAHGNGEISAAELYGYSKEVQADYEKLARATNNPALRRTGKQVSYQPFMEGVGGRDAAREAVANYKAGNLEISHEITPEEMDVINGWVDYDAAKVQAERAARESRIGGRTMAEDIGLRGPSTTSGSLTGVVNEGEPVNGLSAMLKEQGLTMDEYLEKTYGPEEAARLKAALGGADLESATVKPQIDELESPVRSAGDADWDALKNGELDEVNLGRGGEPSFEAQEMAFNDMAKEGRVKKNRPLSKDRTGELFERAREIDAANDDFIPDPEINAEGLPYYETQHINEKRYFGEPEIEGRQVERGFARSMRTEGKIPDEIRKDLTNQPITYTRLGNKETAEHAAQLWAETSDTFDKAEATLTKLINDNDAAAALYAKNLMTAYSEAGQSESALKVMEQISEAMTKRGQFNQAAILALAKDDPMTALKYAQRSIDQMNVDGAKRFGKKWHDFALTDDEMVAFTKIQPGDEKAIRKLYDQIGMRIGAEYPTTIMEKILETRRVDMLFNLRTNIRNAGANVPTMGMRYMADRVEGVGQNIAKIINPDFEVTQAIGPAGRQARSIANEIFDGDIVQDMVRNTNGKYSQIPDLKNQIMKDKQIFKGTRLERWLNDATGGGIERLNKALFGKEHVKSGMETLRNATYKLLEMGDDPFVRENFVQRLGSYVKAQGITSAADVPDAAIQTAWEEAMKATYKDNSWAVKMVSNIKGGIGSIPVIGKPVSDAIIPFVQAPANIAARMVDYSPIRGTKGIYDIISGSNANDLKQVTRGIEELSKGLTGSAMVVAGVALHNAGLITGSYSEDKDQKEFQKQTGYKEYALHIGDKYYQYDWAQPFAEPMMIGTIIADAVEKSDEADDRILQELGEGNRAAQVATGIWDTTKKIGGATVNSWFNESPLQSLATLMGSEAYSSNQTTDIAGNIGKVAQDFALSFIPTLVQAGARGFGQTQRNTYDNTSDIASFLNQGKAKIPGLADTLPAKYDTWGREMTYGRNLAESAASQFLIPGAVGTESTMPIDLEVNRLFESTGSVDVFPHKAGWSINGQKLTNEEQSAYQRDMGQLSLQFAEAVTNSPAYANMDDTGKAEELGFVFGLAESMTKADLFGANVSSTYRKAAETYEAAGGGQAGIEAVLNMRATKNAIEGAGGTVNAKTEAVLQQYGPEGVSTYINAYNNANIDGEGSITIQDTLDYMTQNPDEPDWLVPMLAPSSATGEFTKGRDGVWVYTSSKGQKTGNKLPVLGQ